MPFRIGRVYWRREYPRRENACGRGAKGRRPSEIPFGGFQAASVGFSCADGGVGGKRLAVARVAKICGRTFVLLIGTKQRNRIGGWSVRETKPFTDGA
ncbi:hypothetical protein HMPREF9120_02369 [Neisseria sp. oral taxon 020 str. F0370]|nr:hypothetical protein HMPREF9120_02369 [Neisseria sp. oral taxon 020 str. F0370]